MNDFAPKPTTDNGKAAEVDTAERGKAEVQIEPEYTSASDGEQTWTIIKNLSDVRSAVKKCKQIERSETYAKGSRYVFCREKHEHEF